MSKPRLVPENQFSLSTTSAKFMNSDTPQDSDDVSLMKLAIVSAVEELQDVGCRSKNIEEFFDLTPNHVDIMSTVASHKDDRGRRCAVCQTHPQEEVIINRILLELQRIRNMMLLAED